MTTTTFHTRVKAVPATEPSDLITKGQVDASLGNLVKVRVIGATENPADLNIAPGTVVFRRLV